MTGRISDITNVPSTAPGSALRQTRRDLAVPPPHLNQSPQGTVGLAGPPVWVPGIVFVNTPNTDLTITDTKASLNIRKLGQYSVSTLDNVEQVRSLLVIMV